VRADRDCLLAAARAVLLRAVRLKRRTLIVYRLPQAFKNDLTGIKTSLNGCQAIIRMMLAYCGQNVLLSATSKYEKHASLSAATCSLQARQGVNVSSLLISMFAAKAPEMVPNKV
jgi:hypothetical protein